MTTKAEYLKKLESLNEEINQECLSRIRKGEDYSDLTGLRYNIKLAIANSQ